MKLLINLLTITLLLSSHLGFSDNNLEKELKTEEKSKLISTSSTLPKFITVPETLPAPQDDSKAVSDENLERKASSVELKPLKKLK